MGITCSFQHTITTNYYKSQISLSTMQKLFTVALFAASGLAQEETPEARKFSHIVKMVHNRIAKAGSSWDSKTVSKRLANYACHCFPGNSRIAGGAGPAQDGIDSACKTLAKCHKCISSDYGISAITSEWDENIGKYRWSEDSNGELSCANNDDQYKADLCECDAAFANELGASWDDSNWNNSLWGGRKNNDYALDYDNTCVGSQGAQQTECCGSYPNRMPYNVAMQECCPDGTTSSIGAC